MDGGDLGPLLLEVEPGGAGTPVVLVGGGPGVDHAHYHPWFSRLAERRPVVYYDHPGTGRSTPVSSDAVFTVDGYARAIGLVCDVVRDHLGADTVALVGLSFGGIPAVEFALRHPERVAALVLSNAQVDAAGWQDGNIDHVNQTLRDHHPAAWREILALRASGVTSLDARYQALVGEALPALEWADPWRRPAMTSSGAPPSEAAYAAFVGTDPEWQVSGSLRDCAPALEDVGVPTLVVTGRHDGLTLPRLADDHARRLPHAELHVLERSGHRPWCEEPDEYTRVVTAFLDRSTPSRPPPAPGVLK